MKSLLTDEVIATVSSVGMGSALAGGWCKGRRSRFAYLTGGAGLGCITSDNMVLLGVA